MGENQKQAKKRKRQSDRSDRQISILYKLAIEGRKTIFQLTEELNTNQRAIEKSIEILEEFKSIERVQRVKTRTKSQAYRITEKGIITLSKEKNVTYEQFWNLVYQIYDKKTFNAKITIMKFFNNYEKYVGGFDLDNLSLQWVEFFEDTYGIRRETNIDNIVHILLEIGLAKKISHNTLLKKINKKYKIKNSDICREITNLSNTNIYVRTKNKTYRLSVLGLLVLVHHNPISMTHSENSNRFEELKGIFKNHRNLLPLVCKACNVIPELQDFTDAINYLQDIYERKLIPFAPLQNGGLEEIVYHFRIKNRITTKRVQDYLKEGHKVLGNLSLPRAENINSNVLVRIKYLEHNIGISWSEIDNSIVEKLFGEKRFSLDKIIDKNLADTITFEFFCFYLTHYVYNWRLRGNVEKLNRWKEFCKMNPGIEMKFNSVINDVKDIQNKNIHKMNVESILSL